MRLPAPLVEGRLVRRPNRFTVEVLLGGGIEVLAHCPNSGSMRTCSAPGSTVLLSHSANPWRKLPFTLELYWSGTHWVSVNTNHPNTVVAEAISHGRVPELSSYDNLRREVPYAGHSRIDILLEGAGKKPCYVEVKNCTLLEDDGTISFPDAVTERGTRHLEALMEMVRQGARGVMFFFLGRSDGSGFRPADSTDPVYGRTLRQAFTSGVEILAYGATISPEEIRLEKKERITLPEVHLISARR